MKCLLLIFITLFYVVQIVASNKEFNNDDSNELFEDKHFKSYFKSFENLKLPTEKWPAEEFYRKMSICQHDEFIPFRMYASEGICQSPNATIATGMYRNAQNETGWGMLEIETFSPFTSEVQAYAAGLLEGFLTKTQIHDMLLNTVEDLCKHQSEYCEKLNKYLDTNLQWIEKEVQTKSPDDIYWRFVNLTFFQLTGINDGFIGKEKMFTPKLSFQRTPVYMLQLSGDFYDLEHVFGKKNQSHAGHCSALVKVTEGNQDLLVSHVTWAAFHTMNRIVKLYKFAYDKKQVPGNTIVFPGYPGVLVSSDDYTLTNAGLLSLETTIDIWYKSLYTKYVKPEGQLHCWLRSNIANKLAANARDWVKIFARYNSGTYNDQWTIIDYKLFKPNQELPKADLLWILEQIPGTCVSRDITWFLHKYGYWASYNIPYLSKTSTLSGFVQKGNNNNWWRWGYASRARIFHRDEHRVQNMTTLRELMRYNNYKNDEFSRCKCKPPYTAEAAISSRNDLNPANGTWEVPEMAEHNEGAIDYKGTNYELFKQMRMELIGCPTFGGPGNLPIFSWTNTDIEAPHYGLPLDWNFDPFVTLWRTPITVEMGDEKEF